MKYENSRIAKSLVLAFTFMLSWNAYSDNWVVTTSGGINLRNDPNTLAPPVDSFPFGTVLKPTGRTNGNWIEVTVDGFTGWVSKGKKGQLLSSTSKPSDAHLTSPLFKGDGPTVPAQNEPVPAPSQPDPAASQPDPAANNNQVVQQPSTSHGVDVLYIGDSHSVGCFGKTIDNHMRKLVPPGQSTPLKVDSMATCGTSIDSWVSGPNKSVCTGTNFRSCDSSKTSCPDATVESHDNQDLLSTKLKTDKPKETVVALGTNGMIVSVQKKDKNGNPMFTTNSKGKKVPVIISICGSASKAANSALAMAKQIYGSGSKCIWMGPPNEDPKLCSTANQKVFVKALRDAVEKAAPNGEPYCKFIDSQGCAPGEVAGHCTTLSPIKASGSGLHYGTTSACTWGDQEFEGGLKGLLKKDLAQTIQETGADQDPAHIAPGN